MAGYAVGLTNKANTMPWFSQRLRQVELDPVYRRAVSAAPKPHCMPGGTALPTTSDVAAATTRESNDRNHQNFQVDRASGLQLNF